MAVCLAESITVMVQAAAAQMQAGPGTKDYGALPQCSIMQSSSTPTKSRQTVLCLGQMVR